MKHLRFAAALLFSSLLVSPAFAASMVDTIHARGVLRVGTTGDYKPFTFRNPDGTYVGADIVMAHHLADALHVKLEIVPTTWSNLLPDFVAQKYDVAMGGVSILPARMAQGDFSTIVDSDGKRPIGRCVDKERYTTIEAIDQPGVRVVVNPGGSNETFARNQLSRAQITIYSNNATIFDEIVAGHDDVMVTDGVEVDHQAYIHPELCAADTRAFTKVDKAYLLPKDPAMVKFVDEWLAEEMSSGDWQRTLEAALRQK